MEEISNITQLNSFQLNRALKMREDYFASLKGEQLENALKLQNAINEKLKKAGNQNNRLAVIHNLMMDSFQELHKLSNQLSRNMIDLSESIKKINHHIDK